MGAQVAVQAWQSWLLLPKSLSLGANLRHENAPVT
jgi:hypothetical protein